MLPRAHTACSLMCSIGEDSRAIKAGTAPCSTTWSRKSVVGKLSAQLTSQFSRRRTCCVCQAVPEAMFVRAQAASNCSAGSSSIDRKATKRGSSPASMNSCRGRFRSWDSSFLRETTRQDEPFHTSSLVDRMALNRPLNLHSPGPLAASGLGRFAVRVHRFNYGFNGQRRHLQDKWWAARLNFEVVWATFQANLCTDRLFGLVVRRERVLVRERR